MARKLKSVLISAMLITSLASSALPPIQVNASSSKLIDTGYAIADMNEIVLDSDADAAELAVLNNLNGGILPEIVFEEDHTVSHINGQISNSVIRSKKDAKAVIASIASLLGIQDVDAELSFLQSDSDEFETDYTFCQMYKGLPVEGASITVFADAKSGIANYLNSTFITNLSLDTTPAISSGEVRSIVRKAYNIGLQKDPKLVLINSEDGELRLAYQSITNAVEIGTVYIDALDGRVLQESNCNYDTDSGEIASYRYNKSTPNLITGKKYFEISNELHIIRRRKSFQLHDRSRRIYIIDNTDQDKEINGRIEPSDFHNIINMLTPVIRKAEDLDSLNDHTHELSFVVSNRDYINDPSINYNNQNWDDTEVGVLYQIEQVYDYYKDAFGWLGTDGANNSDLYVVPASVSLVGNAGSSSLFNSLEFGASDSTFYPTAKELGIVAHEYTHSVLSHKLVWVNEMNSISFVLNEGYADIMGEYAQLKKTNSTDWLNGNQILKTSSSNPDNRSFRNISKGAFYTNKPDGKTRSHYFRLTEFKGNLNSINSHDGSTIISHIAYRMHKNGIAPEIAEKIWFKSMDKLKSSKRYKSFEGFRSALKDAAELVINGIESNSAKRKKMLVIVHSALNYSKIFPSTSYKIGDISGDGKADVSDAVLVRRYVNEANLWASNSHSAEVIAKGDVNYDGKITDADADKILLAYATRTPLD